MLDAEADVDATVEVTQLPYPPIFGLEERGADADIRDRYRIEAGNYGFYVYRNKRLISWAERFGLITQHGDFYGFRGRLLIDDSADDAFNIDVKKASITLSDDAERTLNDYAAEYKSKSRTAWQKAITLRKEREEDDTNVRANQMAEGYEPDDLPGEGLPTKEEVEEQSERDAKIREEMRERLRKEAADRKREKEGREVNEDELTEEDLDEALREDTNPSAHKIFRVRVVEDNALWEPYYDAENEVSVRINKHHRFGRLIYEDNFENADLQVLFDLMMLQLAQSEIYARRKLTTHEEDVVKEITAAYRRYVSEFLAGMCRKLDGELPRSDA